MVLFPLPFFLVTCDQSINIWWIFNFLPFTFLRLSRPYILHCPQKKGGWKVGDDLDVPWMKTWLSGLRSAPRWSPSLKALLDLTCHHNRAISWGKLSSEGTFCTWTRSQHSPHACTALPFSFSFPSPLSLPILTIFLFQFLLLGQPSFFFFFFLLSPPSIRWELKSS